MEIYNKSSLFIVAGGTGNGQIGAYAKVIYTSQYTSKLTNKDGYIIYDGYLLVGYNGAETELTIPDGIIEINKYAFTECKSLTSITIPDSVTIIGNRAFEGCSQL